MIARRLNSLDGIRLGIHLETAQGHGAPSLSVWPLPARAAGPTAPFALELAVLEGAVRVGGLGGSEGDVGAGRLVARLEVDEGRGAVVPVDGRVGAGVMSRMAVAHVAGCGLGWSICCGMGSGRLVRGIWR